MGLSGRLTVRDGRTGLWVTESSCVVGGVFVCQRVQECNVPRARDPSALSPARHVLRS